MTGLSMRSATGLGIFSSVDTVQDNSAGTSLCNAADGWHSNEEEPAASATLSPLELLRLRMTTTLLARTLHHSGRPLVPIEIDLWNGRPPLRPSSESLRVPSGVASGARESIPTKSMSVIYIEETGIHVFNIYKIVLTF
jgi:hypothetical protein